MSLYPRCRNVYLNAHQVWHYGNGWHGGTRQALAAEAVPEERFTVQEKRHRAYLGFQMLDEAARALQQKARPAKISSDPQRAWRAKMNALRREIEVAKVIVERKRAPRRQPGTNVLRTE